MSRVAARLTSAELPVGVPSFGRAAALGAAARWVRSGTFLWPATAFMACFAVNALSSRYMFVDSFLDLTGGRYVADHGVPRVEALTVEAAGEPWIQQQWLAHWVYYEAWRIGGYSVLALFSNALVALGFGLLAALLMRRGVVAHRAVMWAVLAYTVCIGNTIIRAQSFAFPLFVALIWLLLDDWPQERLRWRFALFVPALVLWANLHGTALLATLLFAGYAGARATSHLWERRRRAGAAYAAVGALAMLAPFATPYAFSMVDYYASVIGNGTLRRFILEWAPPRLGSPTSIAFFLFVPLVIGAVAYALGRGVRPSPLLSPLAGGSLLLAAQAARYQASFAIVGTVLAAEALVRSRPAPHPLPRIVRAAGAGLIVVAAVTTGAIVGASSTGRFESLTPRLAIAAAAQQAATDPGALILADEVSASALLWRFPETAGRVAYDARFDQYSEEALERWFSYLNVLGPEWLEPARDYDVLVASRSAHPALAARLARLPGWRVLHSDADGIAVVRAETGRR